MCKILKSLAMATCASFALSGVAAAETATIRVSATPSILATMFEELVAAFEAEHPDIDVELEIPAGEQDEQLRDLLRQAVVDDQRAQSDGLVLRVDHVVSLAPTS